MTSSSCFSESLPTPCILLLRNTWAPSDAAHNLEGELDRTANASQGFTLGSSYKPCRSAGVGQDHPCTDLQAGKGKPRGIMASIGYLVGAGEMRSGPQGF